MFYLSCLNHRESVRISQSELVSGGKSNVIQFKLLLIIGNRGKKQTNASKRKHLFYQKNQIQMLCKLYKEQDHLWNISSPDYYKRTRRTAHWKRSKKEW